MNELAAYRAPDLNASQLQTVKATVAKDLNAQEFDLFMEASKSYGLDPFRQQVNAILFSKTKPDKRRMVISVGIGGLRSIAQRCGDYRPASKPSHKEINPDTIGPNNPKGLEFISIVLFKQDSKGDWFEVYGEAYWDEFAPLKENWSRNEKRGRDLPDGTFSLDTTGQWGTKPIVMLEKCAEARALRAGWPDVFSGIYADEELDAEKMRDITPSQAIEEDQKVRREEAVNFGKSILMTFGENTPFVRVEIGELADRCFEHIQIASQKEIFLWSETNREPLREFWSQNPSDALEVKKSIETKLNGFDMAATIAAEAEAEREAHDEAAS